MTLMGGVAAVCAGQLGKREWAKLALSRAKIMEKELAEGEAALAAGELEE